MTFHLLRTTGHALAHQAAHLGAHRLLFVALRPLLATEAAEHLVGHLSFPATIAVLITAETALHHATSAVRARRAA